MAKQVSKTVIGGFVISAIALLIAGVIILGSGAMFKKTNKYIMFFEKSVKGLSVGAPVVWRGVEIGSVSSIVLDANPEKLSIDIPIIIDVDPSRIKVKHKKARNIDLQLKRLIELGLRAQMTLQSIVTGQLMIEIDFFPDTPVRLSGLEPAYPEIPTITSSMDQLAKKFQQLPIDEIANKLLGVIEKIDNLLGDPEILKIVHNFNTASENLNRLVLDAERLVTDTDSHVNNLAESVQTMVSQTQKLLKTASREIQTVSTDARKLFKNTDGQIQPVGKKAQEALVSARRAMDQAKDTLVTVNSLAGEKSDTRHKLNRALDEIGGAARSLHSLTDYLERHPEALLQGKGGESLFIVEHTEDIYL